MKRLYEVPSNLLVILLLALFLAACAGAQVPEAAQPSVTQAITTPPAIKTAAPASSDTPPPTLTAAIPATVTPAPAGPTPTPDLADMMVRVLTSNSPDGMWKAEALLADPYNQHGTFVGELDLARLTVLRTDGSQEWVPYEEWSPTGLGDSYISEFYWSADERYLYFSHSGVADGCGSPFVTNLHRVDLGDGSLSDIPLEGIGLDIITLSPEADQLAYRTEEGFRLYHLESNESRTIPYDWPEGSDYQVEGYAWSPDRNQLAFTLNYNFCGMAENAHTSIRVVDLESGEIRPLTDQDERLLKVTGWTDLGKLQVIDRDGMRHFLSLDTGELQPDETPPGPVPPARQALNDFLNALHLGVSDSSQYDRAVDLYRGSYDKLIEMNPDLDPEAHATLLHNACRQNGFQCLRLREVLSAEVAPAGDGTSQVRLTVNLMSPDGSVFALGPCCGEEEGEPQTEFIFNVEQDESGEFKVLDLPPYMP